MSVRLRALRLSRCYATIGLIALSFAMSTSPTFGDTLRPLPCDHMSPLLKSATLLGHLPSDQTIRFAVTLPLRNQAALEQLVAAQSNPRSAQYLRYLTPEQFAEQFGATQNDYNATIDYLQSKGFRVTKTYKGRLQLSVEGTALQTEQTFGVRLNRYKLGDREFFANEGNPSLPDSVPVQPNAIVGLSTAARMKPCDDGNGNSNGSPPYNPTEIASAYNMKTLRDAGFTGQGQTIAIFAPGDFDDSNLSTFAQKYGLSTTNVVRRLVDGGTTTYEPETDVDVEILLGLAPSAQIQVWVGPNVPISNLDTYAGFVNDNVARIMSSSWTNGWEGDLSQAERDSYHSVFLQAAAQGQTILNASGDFGMNGGHLDPNTGTRGVGVQHPASDPNVFAVGGTSLRMTPQLLWSNETGWSGSGGGLSLFYDRPSWQNATVPGLVNGQSNGKRQLPDVAADGDPLTGYFVYIAPNGVKGWYSVAQTSAATPVWAAGLALIQQALNRSFFAPPLIYQVYANVNAAAPFHDIQNGNNGFACTFGWDYVTGCGSADFGGLRTGLASLLSTAKLTGRVLDRYRQPIVGAEIHLYSIENKQFIPANATADANGLYQINLANVPPGHYHIGAYKSSAYNQWIFSPSFQGYLVQSGGGDIGPIEIVLEDADSRSSGIFGFVRYDDATGAHPIGSGVHIDVYSGGHLVTSTDSAPDGTYRITGLQAKLSFWGFNTFIATWKDPQGVQRTSAGVNFGTWPGVSIRTDVVFTIP